MVRRRRKNNANEGWITLAVVVLAAFVALVSASGGSMSRVYAAVFLVVVLAVGAGLAAYRYAGITAQRKALHALELSNVDTMNGLDFERYIGELLRTQGYKIRFTPVNDYGVDVIAKKGGSCIAVQAKRYVKPVGVSAVQEVCAGMAQHHCNASMVVTNSTFTRQAKNLATSNSCTLVDRDRLARWIAAGQDAV